MLPPNSISINLTDLESPFLNGGQLAILAGTKRLGFFDRQRFLLCIFFKRRAACTTVFFHISVFFLLIWGYQLCIFEDKN